MLKKVTALILALVMALCLPGCAAGSDTEQTYPALSVAPSPNSAILSAKAGNIVQLEAGPDRIAVLLTDGSVICVENYDSGEPSYAELGWTDIIKIDVSGSAIVGLRSDGMVLAAGHDIKDDLGWEGDASERYHYNRSIFEYYEEFPVVDIASCAGRVVALRSDGTVESTNPGDELDTWTNIVDIDTMHSSFANKIFGVRADGTVMETGDGDDCYTTSGWTDIVDICAGWSSVAGLKSDGTVLISETPEREANMGAVYETFTWSGITELSGYSEIVGLKADGTVVSTGLNEVGAGNVSSWYDVADVAAGEYFTVALKKDGTIVGTSQTENWNLSMLYG